MTVTPLRPRPPGNVYTDILGRRWDVERLDRLLADAAVRGRVQALADAVAVPEEGTFNPGAALVLTGHIHPRDTVRALWLALVVRYFDTDGAHLLGRGAVG